MTRIESLKAIFIGVVLKICSADRPRSSKRAGHAARQLARPIEELGIKVGDFAEKIFLFR